MDNPVQQINRIIYISGDQIDREKWDQCMDRAINGNICNYSWFLDLMCKGWGGLVADDYAFIMPVPFAKKLEVQYLLQPLFIQQSGVFGAAKADVEIVGAFINALPKAIRIIDYHFNDQNSLPPKWNVDLRPNLLLSLDRSYVEIRKAYSHNLDRNLKKSLHEGFHILNTDHPDPLIKLFRAEKGVALSELKDQHYKKLSAVITACLIRKKAEVWTVYNRENELCAGIVWLFSHGKAVFYFSAQSKAGREKGALAWLIDAFIRENASSGTILDFEGSADPGLARFYGSFGSVMQPYPRLKLNHLSPLLKLAYRFYRKWF